MAIFLSCEELYESIQQKSLETKEILWVCSPRIGLEAHTVFSQEILKNPPSDIRFIFRLNENSMRMGEVNPYEIQYFIEHFKGSSIKSHDDFNSKIYIFDNSALIASADLTKTAFESTIEVGVILEGSEVDEVKNFFDQNLWETAKPIGDLKKFKQIWNAAQKNAKNDKLKKAKIHTKIMDWTDDYVSTWYIGVPCRLSKKTERKIKKETNWQADLSLVGDVGYRTFKQLKLGDLAFLANLNKKRGKIEIELARIFDKSRVETDEGDLHFVYEPEKTYLLERQQFYEMLKNADISSRTFETTLSDDQIKNITNILSSIKHKRRKKIKT
jgi:hypothetical protein